MNGVYCTGKFKFANNLAKYAKSLGMHVHVFKKGWADLPKLNNKMFVDEMFEFLAQKEIKGGDKVLIVLPSSLNTKLIVDNILRMQDFTDKCDLKAIITKINTNNFYHNDHKQVCENFLTFCNAGYSQYIIVDNYGANE